MATWQISQLEKYRNFCTFSTHGIVGTLTKSDAAHEAARRRVRDSARACTKVGDLAREYIPCAIHARRAVVRVRMWVRVWSDRVWADGKPVRRIDSASEKAAWNGDIAELRRALECEVTDTPYASRDAHADQTCLRAAERGHLECLKYAHENGCPWDSRVFTVAAFEGHLDCLRYLDKNGCPWDQNTCAGAAKGGHLDCLKYLHENGCPWNTRACFAAAGVGSLDCLKYLHENGCPWNTKTCDVAAKESHFDCLKYLHENGCPWDEKTYEAAAVYGRLEVLKYVHEHGCPFKPIMSEFVARHIELSCMQYLHANGLPCDWGLISALTSRGDDVKQYALRQLGVVRETIRDMSGFQDLVLSSVRVIMSEIDEIKEDIPNGAYLTIATSLKRLYDESSF